MKTSSDPRHKAREQAIQELFAWDFHPNLSQSSLLTKNVIEKVPEIDKIISVVAPEWPIEQIAKSDLSILRLSVFELLFGKTAPEKVVIDEAVELAKEFGSDSSSSFVNGVLGTVVKDYLKSS